MSKPIKNQLQELLHTKGVFTIKYITDPHGSSKPPNCDWVSTITYNNKVYTSSPCKTKKLAEDDAAQQLFDFLTNDLCKQENIKWRRHSAKTTYFIDVENQSGPATKLFAKIQSSEIPQNINIVFVYSSGCNTAKVYSSIERGITLPSGSTRENLISYKIDSLHSDASDMAIVILAVHTKNFVVFSNDRFASSFCEVYNKIAKCGAKTVASDAELYALLFEQQKTSKSKESSECQKYHAVMCTTTCPTCGVSLV